VRICGGRRVRFPPATRRSAVALSHGKRRTTGMKTGMKESYVEDLASHDGPDHALATREGAAKRWFGERAGRAIQPRNGARSGCRRGHGTRKATSLTAFWRAASGPRGVEDPEHVRDLFMSRAGRSHGHPPVVMGGRVARGRPRP
jgi:hypothetical protein